MWIIGPSVEIGPAKVGRHYLHGFWTDKWEFQVRGKKSMTFRSGATVSWAGGSMDPCAD
jgi:hypothetical protein